MAKLITVEADCIGAISGKMICAAAFAAGLHVVVMVETKKVPSKSHVARYTAFKGHSVVPVAVGDQRVSLKCPPPAREDHTVRLQALLDRQVQHLVWRVVNGQKGKFSVRKVRRVTAASDNEGRALENLLAYSAFENETRTSPVGLHCRQRTAAVRMPSRRKLSKRSFDVTCSLT